MPRGFGFDHRVKKTRPTAPTVPTLQAAPAPAFDQLPDSALLREAHLVPSPKRPGPALLPFSASTLWRMVREGRFPKPVKLSKGVTCWKVGDVRQFLAQQGESNVVQLEEAH